MVDDFKSVKYDVVSIVIGSQGFEEVKIELSFKDWIYKIKIYILKRRMEEKISINKRVNMIIL